MPSYAALCSEFKEHPAYRALPAHIGQEVIKKARKAWDSFFACLRLYRKGELERPPRIPRYWKDRRTGKRTFCVIPVKAPTSYTLNSRTLSLTLPRDLREKHGGRLVLRTKGVLRFHGTPKTLELRYDRAKKRWYAHQVVEVPEPERKAKPEKYAALDLGARILAALAIEGVSRQILFSGRKVWKDFLYWTKRIAEEQARLARAGRKTSRQLRKLYQTRARRLRHAYLALAAEIARTLSQHRVTTLFLEDPPDGHPGGHGLRAEEPPGAQLLGRETAEKPHRGRLYAGRDTGSARGAARHLFRVCRLRFPRQASRQA